MTFSIATHLADTTTLHNGVKMPWFGLGVYKAQAGAEVEQAVLAALRHGYRSIDTAKLYANEDSVGKALKASEMAREDVFITTIPKKMLCRESHFSRLNEAIARVFSA